MRILIAGSSGFLGQRIVRHLRDSGHQVTRLVRREPRDASESRWDPAAGTVDRSTVETADAVINLAGATVARPWTKSYKRKLFDSRVGATGTLAGAIAALPAADRPAVWLNASGVDAYGDTDGRPVDESAPLGHGFLADMCRAWEGATGPAADAGVRVALLRTGFPLSRHGGFLKPQILQFRLFAGGRLASGRQYIPWIGMPDYLAAVDHLLTRDVAGPVNMVGPEPVTNAEFAKAMAKVLHRPSLIPAPGFALKLLLGELGEAMLASKRVVPGVLVESGFQYRYRTLDEALRYALTEAKPA